MFISSVGNLVPPDGRPSDGKQRQEKTMRETAASSPAVWVAYAKDARDYYEIRKDPKEAFEAFAFDWEGSKDDIVVEDLFSSSLLYNILMNMTKAQRFRERCGDLWPLVRRRLLDDGWIIGDLGV
jgi:hypothetical protein